MCSAAIFQAKIGKVVYGVSRRDLPQTFRQRALSICDLANDSGYSPVIVPGVLKDDILQLFSGVARI
jgi:tRNA(Arg) A34 adenosine deaminase TadA